MIYLALCIICIIAVELFILVPIEKPIQQLVAASRNSAKVVASSRMSDRRKEKILPKYAIRIAGSTLKAFLMLVLVVGSVWIAALLLQYLLPLERSIIDFLVSWQGLLLATIVSFAYWQGRKRLMPVSRSH